MKIMLAFLLLLFLSFQNCGDLNSNGARSATSNDELSVVEPKEEVNILNFGAVGDGVTDDSDAIQNAIDSTEEPVMVLIPKGTFKVTKTIYLRRNGVHLVGEGVTISNIQYENPEGGILFSGDEDTFESLKTYANCAIKDLSVKSSGVPSLDASIIIDFSSFSYSYFNIKAQTRRPNGIIYYAQGNAGHGPYFNHIESVGLFGGADYSQTAIKFASGQWQGGSDGPNANVIGPILRAAALKYVVDLEAGHQNLFSQITGESINDTYFKIGDNRAAGRATSSGGNSQVSFTRTNNGSWMPNEFVNGAIKIVSGKGEGQIRRIGSNTAQTISITQPWSIIPDSTSVGEFYPLKASGNKFMQIRGEGLASLNPNWIHALPDSDHTEFSQFDVSSLGEGSIAVDETGSVRNKLFGAPTSTYSHTIRLASGQNDVEIYPRTGVFGGKQIAGKFVVKWVKVSLSNNINRGGDVKVSLAVGGTSLSDALQLLEATVENGSTIATGLPKAGERLVHTNKPLFLNLKTDADYIGNSEINVTYGIALL